MSTDILVDLNRVCEFEDLSQVTLASQLGVKFDFCGKGQNPPQVHHVHQVHGTQIVEANSNTSSYDLSKRVQADGLFTRDKGLKLAIKTADCLPVFLLTHDKTKACALHAGWRGLTAGILEKGFKLLTCDQMHRAQDIYAILGPCIGAKHYEVGSDVIEALKGPQLAFSQEHLQLCLRESDRPSHWLFDLSRAGLLHLLKLGVKAQNISVHTSCTYQNHQRWYSYRREAQNPGRNWSWLSL